MEDLQKDIQEDLQKSTSEETQKQYSNFEKMSLAALSKQDKKMLLQYADERGLLKDLSKWNRNQLTRIKLAEIIKGQNKQQKSHAKEQEQPQEINELQNIQFAVTSALNGDYSQIDKLALNNVQTFIFSQGGEEMSYEAKERLKLVSFVASSGYLLFKFTGGLNFWKTRFFTLVNYLREKRKK